MGFGAENMCTLRSCLELLSFSVEPTVGVMFHRILDVDLTQSILQRFASNIVYCCYSGRALG